MSWRSVRRRGELSKLASCPGCAAPTSLVAKPVPAPAPTPQVKQLPPPRAAEPAKPPTIPKLAHFLAGCAGNDMDFRYIGRAAGAAALKKVAAADYLFNQDLPVSDYKDMLNMEGNKRVIDNTLRAAWKDAAAPFQDTVIANADGTASIKPGGGLSGQFGTEAGGEVAKKGGFMSKLTGKKLAIGGLGALALGGLAYGAYRHNQNRRQQGSQLGGPPPYVGSGAYQAGYGY